MFSLVVFIVLITGKDRSTKKIYEQYVVVALNFDLNESNNILSWYFAIRAPINLCAGNYVMEVEIIKRNLHNHAWIFKPFFFPLEERGIKRKWLMDKYKRKILLEIIVLMHIL